MSDETKKPKKPRRPYTQAWIDPAMQARAARKSIPARDTKRADASLRTFSWMTKEEGADE